MKINRSIQFIGRLVASALILGVTAFFTPGFTSSSIWILALTVIVLTTVDFLIDNFTKLYFHPMIKFILGFILSGLALFLVQYFVVGYMLSFVSLFLGALIYGLVDYMLPNEEHAASLNGKQIIA